MVSGAVIVSNGVVMTLFTANGAAALPVIVVDMVTSGLVVALFAGDVLVMALVAVVGTLAVIDAVSMRVARVAAVVAERFVVALSGA